MTPPFIWKLNRDSKIWMMMSYFLFILSSAKCNNWTIKMSSEEQDALLALFAHSDLYKEDSSIQLQVKLHIMKAKKSAVMIWWQVRYSDLSIIKGITLSCVGMCSLKSDSKFNQQSANSPKIYLMVTKYRTCQH